MYNKHFLPKNNWRPIFSLHSNLKFKSPEQTSKLYTCSYLFCFCFFCFVFYFKQSHLNSSPYGYLNSCINLHINIKKKEP